MSSGLAESLLPVIGTIDIDSTPPATTTSCWPSATEPAAMAIAWRPDREPAEQAREARHVEALLALGHRAAEHEVLDVGGLELRHAREQPLQHIAHQLVGALVREGTLDGPAHGRTDGLCDDDVHAR
jgi:hypothetical protein